MAIPTCPKCPSHIFAVTEFEPIGANFKHMAIHCSSCGAVVGVMDYYNIGNMLKMIGRKLGLNL
jgi:hypothetical protein